MHLYKFNVRNVGFLSDVNTQDATKKRKQIFGMAAESKMLISGMRTFRFQALVSFKKVGGLPLCASSMAW